MLDFKRGDIGTSYYETINKRLIRTDPPYEIEIVDAIVFRKNDKAFGVAINYRQFTPSADTVRTQMTCSITFF